MTAIGSTQTWNAAFDELSTMLAERFTEWGQAPRWWSDAAFEPLARDVFTFQFRFNPPYRTYCEGRGVTPDSVTHWTEIPPVPTAVFREVDLVSGPKSEVALTFRTSGTTRGDTRRGRHNVLSPSLYRASLRATFAALVAPESPANFCTLHHSFTSTGDSSLAWMLDDVVAAFGTERSVRAARAGGLDFASAAEFCVSMAATETPVFLLGTTLAFDSLVAWMRERGVRVSLPEGSRVMDTGGSKGRAGLERSEVIAGLAEHLGISSGQVVNEFGMTELLSQRYSVAAPGAGRLVGPPWLRSRALDPVTLRRLPDGEPGLLCHFDLANLGSVSMVLTEDMGTTHGDEIEWHGRTPGAPPRGCSLATAELLEARNAG